MNKSNVTGRTSRRHHFIPEFFTKGFIHPSKTIWIYDKTTDRISSRSPKSIFYQFNRNTITLLGQEIDIIETEIFKYLDNFLAKHFQFIQKAPVKEVQNSYLMHYVLIMAATMYYRTPATESFIKNFDLKDLDGISSPIIRNMISEKFNLRITESDRSKLINCIAPFINSYFFEEKPVPDHGYFKIFEVPNPCFILSDNPIINETIPKDFRDLTNSIIFPLTSKRAFYGLKGETNSFNDGIAKAINLILAIQAKQYFGSSSKVLLEIIVNAYKRTKFLKPDILYLIKEVFFMINK